jgi:hypothetical protein
MTPTRYHCMFALLTASLYVVMPLLCGLSSSSQSSTRCGLACTIWAHTVSKSSGVAGAKAPAGHSSSLACFAQPNLVERVQGRVCTAFRSHSKLRGEPAGGATVAGFILPLSPSAALRPPNGVDWLTNPSGTASVSRSSRTAAISGSIDAMALCLPTPVIARPRDAAWCAPLQVA